MQEILFVPDRSGTYDLYVMNLDGSSIRQLTDTREYENFPQYFPAWSPEVTEIVVTIGSELFATPVEQHDKKPCRYIQDTIIEVGSPGFFSKSLRSIISTENIKRKKEDLNLNMTT